MIDLADVWPGDEEAELLDAVAGGHSLAAACILDLAAGDDAAGHHPAFSNQACLEVLRQIDVSGIGVAHLNRRAGSAENLRAVLYAVWCGTLPIYQARDAAAGLPVDLEIPRVVRELQEACARS